MHPKWIAVAVFWAAVIVAIALPSPKTGDFVWFAILLAAAAWAGVAVAVRAIRNAKRPGALERAFFSGLYPRWLSRFIGDDYAVRK